MILGVNKIICEIEIPLYGGIGKEIVLHGREDIVYKGKIELLSAKDIDKIMKLENKTNIPEIRAGESTILYRFSKGMQMFGFLMEDEKLVSSLGFRFDKFFPEKPGEFPETFEEYTTPSYLPPRDFNSVCTNGFNIDYELRNKGLGGIIAKEMLMALKNQGGVSGCKYLVADPRLHTYNGCNQPPIEKFRQNTMLREAVDKAMNREREFTIKDLLRDPEFRIYNRLIGGGAKLLKLMPNTWFPGDYPSGGHGACVYVEL